MNSQERAIFDTQFAGRFFAVGNTYTKTVLGDVGTFNQAYDSLDQDPNFSGNACDVVEVTEQGEFIK